MSTRITFAFITLILGSFCRYAVPDDLVIPDDLERGLGNSNTYSTGFETERELFDSFCEGFTSKSLSLLNQRSVIINENRFLFLKKMFQKFADISCTIKNTNVDATKTASAEIEVSMNEGTDGSSAEWSFSVESKINRKGRWSKVTW